MNPADPNGLVPDRDVAKYFRKHKKTLERWDKTPSLKALGWPDVVYINGRRHRDLTKLREFERNLVNVHLSGPQKVGEKARKSEIEISPNAAA